MANKAILTWTQPETKFSDLKSQNLYNKLIDGGKMTIQVPLIDDVTINLNTTFKTVSQILPLTRSAEQVFSIQNAVQGKMSKFQSMFDLPIWDSTEPISLDFEILLYTITNAYTDVYAPAKAIEGLSVLTKKDDNSFEVPGISLATMNSFLDQEKDDNTLGSEPVSNELYRNAKLLDLHIPGILHVDKAIVRSAKPTFSKELTESGFPPWCRLSVSISSLFPASDFDLEEEGLKILGGTLDTIASFIS